MLTKQTRFSLHIVFVALLLVSAVPPSVLASGPSCSQIPEGSAAILGPTLNYFDDIAAGDYLLIRKPSVAGQDQYDLVLNYRFSPDSPQVESFVRTCFKRMSQYLIGPNGEQIHLRLPEPGDPQIPKAHDVSIGPQCGARGEAMCWTPYYTCPTILHETMHHLGLVDEYHENQMHLSCRSEGPENSLMSDYHKADQAVEPLFNMIAYKCGIFSSADREKCRHALDLISSGMRFHHDPKTPYYSVTFENGEVLPLYQDVDLLRVQQDHEILNSGLVPGAAISYTRNGFDVPDATIESLSAAAAKYSKPVRMSADQLNQVQVIPGERKSILYPAEASTILYGKCSVNATFLRCEKGAYSNHFCPSKPSVCPRGQESAAWVELPSAKPGP